MSTSPRKRAVFLDRDGTLIEEKFYLSDPEQVVIFPGVGPSLRRLMDAGFLLFIVTNQAGIGRGYYAEADMHRVNARLCELLAKAGVRFEKIYFAPEAPDQPSRSRKPSPQFLLDARDEFGVDLSQSYMIGDKFIDDGRGCDGETIGDSRAAHGLQADRGGAAAAGSAGGDSRRALGVHPRGAVHEIGAGARMARHHDGRGVPGGDRGRGVQRPHGGQPGAARAGAGRPAPRGVSATAQTPDSRGLDRGRFGTDRHVRRDAGPLVGQLLGSAVSLTNRCLTSLTIGCNAGSASFHRSMKRP